MLQHEKNEQANPVNSFLHSRRYSFVREWLGQNYGKKPVRILEIGVGFGRLFAELNDHLNIYYTGIEFLDDFYVEAQQRLGKYENCRLLKGSILDSELQNQLDNSYDVVIALETFEHISAREVAPALDFLRNKIKCSFFLSSVPVELGCTILIKNLGSMLLQYGRYKEYSLKETMNAALLRTHRISPHSADKSYPGHKGFDWRFYRYLLHQDFEILSSMNLPFRWLPAIFSTNVLIIARPRNPLPESDTKTT
ncbi:MAG: class I SAM-dependent methyltransferase [Candidatus Cloacimonadaceae bacterium]